MTAYMGSRTTSKNTKNSTRSPARNVPRMPTSSTSSSALSVRPEPPGGTFQTEYAQQRNVRRPVSTTSGKDSASRPSRKSMESDGTHGKSNSSQGSPWTSGAYRTQPDWPAGISGGTSVSRNVTPATTA